MLGLKIILTLAVTLPLATSEVLVIKQYFENDCSGRPGAVVAATVPDGSTCEEVQLNTCLSDGEGGHYFITCKSKLPSPAKILPKRYVTTYGYITEDCSDEPQMWFGYDSDCSQSLFNGLRSSYFQCSADGLTMYQCSDSESCNVETCTAEKTYDLGCQYIPEIEAYGYISCGEASATTFGVSLFVLIVTVLLL